jgi:capsular polysaccharide biosynthesis protein
LDAILAIAQSDAVATQVIQALENDLPPRLKKVEALKGMVHFTNKGDIILVTAAAEDPLLASKIANTWAEQALVNINTAYSGQQPLEEIQSQAKTTRGEYEKSQASLEAFVKENNINLLEKQVAEAQTLLNRLGEERAWRIAYYSNRRQLMEDLRVQAEALKLQLQGGSRSQAGNRGDALAVLLARTEALGINLKNAAKQQPTEKLTNPQQDQTVNPVDSPEFDFNNQGGVTLNVQIGEIAAQEESPASLAADLDALINLAEGEIQRSDEMINDLLEQVTQGQGYEEIAMAANQIGVLQTQLEAERSRERELTSQRDLSWDAYQAMAQKEAEIRNATQTNNQVSLAGQAIPPENPTSRGAVRNALVGGVLGLILGTAIVLAGYWWRSVNRESPVARAG